jgi:phosphohistidine phosphatase
MHHLSEWMGASLQPPVAVLCSPARRTRETFGQIAPAWPDGRFQAQFPATLYETTAGGLHALAGAAFETAERVLLIGHNPSIENLVMQLTGAGAPGRMETGTLAVVDFPGGWAPGGGHGRLRHWVRHRDLMPGARRAQGAIDSR